MNGKIRAITIKLPFGLRWLKKYVKLEIKDWSMPKRIRGQTADVVIFDEVGEVKE